MKKGENKLGYVIFIVLVAASGGLLFGFDMGVTSGAVNYLQDTRGWGLSDSTIEWITSAMLIGAVVGAIFGGRLTDIFGRRKMIMIAAFIATVGAYYTGAASSPMHLIIGRSIIGLAVGASSLVVPLYIAEISPTRIRGALVTMNQLFIALGIKLSDIIAYFIANDADPFSWRGMFYVGMIPGVILLLGMFFLPESPRWLISKGFENEGKKILSRTEDPGLVNGIIAKIKKDIALYANQAPIRELFKPWLRKPLIIGIGIMFFQQASGINSIIFYSPKIFMLAGIDSAKQTLVPTIIVGVVALFFTILSLFLVDRVGRRKLYFIGFTGMIIFLILLGLSFYYEEELGQHAVVATMVSMLCYNSFYAISLGPLGWLLISEVFPIKARGAGMSIATVTNWITNAIVAFTFLKLINAFSEAQVFWLYAGMGVLALIWGYFYIPETKGVTLEEIEDHWRAGKSPREL